MVTRSNNVAAVPDADCYAQRNAQYWKRNLTICVLGSFSTLVSLTLLLPFRPIYVAELGVHQNAAIVEWSGMAIGATFLGTGLSAPLWGYLSDRFGRKPMLVRAAIGIALLMTMIGPLIGGLLPGLIGIRHTFFIGGGVIAIAALATIFFVREDFTPAPVGARPASVKLDGMAWLAVAPMFGTAMLVLLSNMPIEPIITVYLDEMGVDRGHVVLSAGVVMAASAFGSLLMAARLGRLADRIGGRKVIVYCLVVGGVLLLPQAFVGQWWQRAVLRFLMGMGLAGLLPSIAKVIRQSVSDKVLGKVLGYSRSSQYAGQVLGPLLGGAWVGRRACAQYFS